MLTVDVAAPGNRLRDLRTDMTYPPRLILKSFLDASYRVEWWFNRLTTEPYRFTFQDDTFSRGALSDPSAPFDALRWLKEIWKGPIVVKGTQALDEAKRASDFGADGIVLSSRRKQLDRTRPPLHLLPDAVAAVGARTDITIDTGIRAGPDIVVCIALGAKFTWVGRAYLYGLMAGGEAGVDRDIAILRSEVKRMMLLLGVARTADLNPGHVQLLARAFPLARLSPIPTR